MKNAVLFKTKIMVHCPKINVLDKLTNINLAKNDFVC